MRILIPFVFVVTIGVACASRARAIADPTTAPSSDEITSLVAKLGDVDFHARSEASNRLREIGAPALPALKQAANDNNPEVRSRARRLVGLLELRHVPGRPRNHGYTRNNSINMSIIDGRRSVDVNDEGRQIHILQGDDGIQMTVTGEIDGRPATETYKASSPDQLKAENPEAFTLYDRFSGVGGDLNLRQGGLFLQGNGNVVVMPQPRVGLVFRAGGDDLGQLRTQVDDQMQKSQLTPEQRREVHDAMDEVEQSRQLTALGAPDGLDDRMERYDRACDRLRKVLGDYKLPDPGDALPPPRGARLGISIQPDPVTGGMSVSHVVPKSRADRIGLQDDDVIRKVNGKEVSDVKELRRLVTEHVRDLALDITRDGREMKLKEKSASTQPDAPVHP